MGKITEMKSEYEFLDDSKSYRDYIAKLRSIKENYFRVTRKDFNTIQYRKLKNSDLDNI
jgi:hypothetical protein